MSVTALSFLRSPDCNGLRVRCRREKTRGFVEETASGVAKRAGKESFVKRCMGHGRKIGENDWQPTFGSKPIENECVVPSANGHDGRRFLRAFGIDGAEHGTVKTPTVV